ncbi:MAG: hypothetical protein M1826_005713 [Phylliscum demangeonii]|nr:MAG: hypothetical protein M1826_005713 [Phylliscum demangeonii]
MAPRTNRRTAGAGDQGDLTLNLQGPETVLGRSQYAVIIIGIEGIDLPHIETLLTKGEASNSLRLKMVVDTKEDHRSYRILGTTRQFPTLTDDNPNNEISFSLRMGLKALTLIQFHGARNETTTLPAIAHDIALVAQTAQEESMTAIPTVKGSKVIEIGLLQQRPYSVEAIKVFLLQPEPRQLAFLFRAPEALGQDLDRLAERFDEESQSGLLASWHSAHPSRIYVQYGQIPLPEDRPTPRYTSQLAFTDYGEYVTC